MSTPTRMRASNRRSEPAHWRWSRWVETPTARFIFMDHFQYGWSSRTGLIREALAAAHRLTGDQRYLDAGLAGGQAVVSPRRDASVEQRCRGMARTPAVPGPGTRRRPACRRRCLTRARASSTSTRPSVHGRRERIRRRPCRTCWPCGTSLGSSTASCSTPWRGSTIPRSAIAGCSMNWRVIRACGRAWSCRRSKRKSSALATGP